MNETMDTDEKLNDALVDSSGNYEDLQRMRWLGRQLLLRAVLEDEHATPRAGGDPPSCLPAGVASRRRATVGRIRRRAAVATLRS